MSRSLPDILLRKVEGGDPELFKPPFSSIVPPLWVGEAVAVVGTGPSLKGFDFERLRGLCRVLAVKEAMHDLPFADTVFGLDIPWIRHRRPELEARTAAGGEVILSLPDQLCLPQLEVAGATYVRRSREFNRMCEDPTRIEAGAHSGFGALNVAFHRMPAVIVLFGYDYGPGHYNEQRYAERGGGTLWAKYAPKWVDNFAGLKKQFADRGIYVINANPDSNLREFDRVSHADAFALLHRMGPARD